MGSTLERLQQWYAAQCDGDWEHGYGIRISTLDNPGWRVTIALEGTMLDGHDLPTGEHGLNSDESADWHRVWIENNQFEGAGDPTKLKFLLEQFLAWAERPGG